MTRGLDNSQLESYNKDWTERANVVSLLSNLFMRIQSSFDWLKMLLFLYESRWNEL